MLTIVGLVFCMLAGAQTRVGVIGGMASERTDIVSVEDFKSLDQYHGGISLRAPLGFGFFLQPELTYTVKATSLDEALRAKFGYLELGVQGQVGATSPVLSPYAFVEPYVGYALTNELVGVVKNNWDYVHKLEYGLACGAGIVFFDHIQLFGKYYWNLGNVYNGDETIDKDHIVGSMSDAIRDGQQFSGLVVGASLLF